jgi:hypothetical protein
MLAVSQPLSSPGHIGFGNRRIAAEGSVVRAQGQGLASSYPFDDHIRFVERDKVVEALFDDLHTCCCCYCILGVGVGFEAGSCIGSSVAHMPFGPQIEPEPVLLGPPFACSRLLLAAAVALPGLCSCCSTLNFSGSSVVRRVG